MKVLEFVNLTKRFGDCTSFRDVSFSVEKGEVHAILGENGAGKSTLMNTLFGLYSPTAGYIKINEKQIRFKSPLDAFNHKIGMVHQHFMLVHNLTVLENILLGHEKKTLLGFTDYQEDRKKLEAILAKYNLQIDLDKKIEEITVGMQQRVEILKILFKDADILIFDEPTAVLTPSEIEDFEKMILNLKADGKTILIITHKLKEIKAVADRCTILRKGEYIETVQVKTTSEEDLASKMVGRTVDLKSRNLSKKDSLGEVVIDVKNLEFKDQKGIYKIKGLNLTLHQGEIFGIAGIDGNGQRELAEILFGLTAPSKGEVIFKGKSLLPLTPKKAFKEKISLIPEDRHKTGLVLDFNVAKNLILHDHESSKFSKLGLLNFKNIYTHAKDLIARFDIRPSDPSYIARSMSGGNQQKIILAREIENNPELLIAVQPTRGLDVGAIEVIHQELYRLREKGKTILLISFELDEVMNVSDRIGVIFDGSIVDIFDRPDFKRETIGLKMSGNKDMA